MPSIRTVISTPPGTFRIQPVDHGAKTINIGTIERLMSVIGGAILTFYELTRLDLKSIVLALLGGSAIYRGITGHSFLYSALGVNTGEKRRSTLKHLSARPGIRVRRTMTVNRSAESLYHFWHEVENLPFFMKYIQSVTSTGDNRSHWMAKAPITGATVEWDSEVTVDQENRYIAWRILGETPLAHAGSVRFEPALYSQETVVTLTLDFYQRGGPVVQVITQILGYVPEQLTLEDLRRFKELMEAGDK
jgi:uncharacterized membrane protein